MNHQVSPIKDVSSVEVMKQKFAKKFCDKHSTEEINFYCNDCKITFCTKCFIGKHNKHNCCEIEEIIGGIKSGFKQHSDDVNQFLLDIKHQSEQVDEQVRTFSIGIDTTEKKIIERSEAIKQMVDRHTQVLLEKLNSQKSKILKNVQSTKEEIQRNMIICENFIAYCLKAIEEADAVESIRIAEELRTRADEIKRMTVPNLTSLPDINFLSSDVNTTKQDNIVGEILGEISKKNEKSNSFSHSSRNVHTYIFFDE